MQLIKNSLTTNNYFFRCMTLNDEIGELMPQILQQIKNSNPPFRYQYLQQSFVILTPCVCLPIILSICPSYCSQYVCVVCLPEYL